MTARITALYDDEANANPSMINNIINMIVETIQITIELSKLSRSLKAIMNSWIRTNSWYNEDKMSKFEHCLRNVVSREIRHQTIKLLIKNDIDYDRPVNEMDLYVELYDAYNDLNYWDWDMDTELTCEAINWVANHGECLIESDYDRPFSWFSAKTMSTQYHLPHVHRHRNNIDIVSLEVLAHDFKHEPEWTCSICLAVDAVDSRCVRTACKHIFHMGCLDDCKRVFLQQEENHNKTCAPCPLCRAPIY
jgi:hypothetical protein